MVEMLKEITATKQNPGEPLRRWFADRDMDLIVWIDGYRMVGFQLVFSSDPDHHVIAWHEGKVVTYSGLDDGEGAAGRPKMAPVLIAGHAKVDLEALHRRFMEVASDLPGGIAGLVETKITELRSAKVR